MPPDNRHNPVRFVTTRIRSSRDRCSRDQIHVQDVPSNPQLRDRCPAAYYPRRTGIQVLPALSCSSSLQYKVNANVCEAGSGHEPLAFLRDQAMPSPLFSERPKINFECPGLWRLLREEVNGFRYLGGFHEEIVGLAGHLLPGSRQIHDAVENYVAHMNFFRPEIPCQ